MLIALLRNQVASQVVGFGQCPNITPLQNFDATRYLGHWYEIRAYPTVFELGGSCVTADYGQNADGTVSVVNNILRFGRQTSITGSATIPQPGQGALIVNFPGAPSMTLIKYKLNS